MTVTVPPVELADRIELYLDDKPGDGGHSDAAGANCWELLYEAMQELRCRGAALGAIYEWHDRDGSVGGASEVFETYRSALPSVEQAS